MLSIQIVKSDFLIFLSIVFVLFKSTLAFYQFKSTPLDGDFAGGIFDDSLLKPFKEDPFCFDCLINNTTRTNPNKPIPHLVYASYFRNIPPLISNDFKALDSVYISVALSKLFIQLSILFLLAKIIQFLLRSKKKNIILIAALLSPLFQTEGFNRTMGIIDQSVAYSFFYAGGLSLLLLNSLLIMSYIKEPSSILKLILFIFLVVLMGPIINFSGPISLAGSMSLITVYWAYYFIEKRKETSPTLITLNWISLYYFIIGMYSIYIGSFNTLDSNSTVSLLDRYLLLPKGLFKIITVKLGLPLLLVFCIFNYILLLKYELVNNNTLKKIVQYFFLFTIIYLLSIPLGGYRDYRPYIIRYDTFLPITTLLIGFFGMTTMTILKTLKRKNIYICLLSLFLAIFIYSDRYYQNKNHCEIESIILISESQQDKIRLKTDCTVWTWNKIKNPDYSIFQAEAMYYYRITDKIKKYYW